MLRLGCGFRTRSQPVRINHSSPIIYPRQGGRRPFWTTPACGLLTIAVQHLIRTSGGLSMRIEDVLQRVQGEFVEMPGLCLTAAQAQRLWGLDREMCDRLLEALVDANFLSQRRDGSFIRVDG